MRRDGARGLVGALTGARRSAPALRALIGDGERVSFSALVLYEWLRGPRRAEELQVQEALFPGSQAVPFGRAEAALASELCQVVRRSRGREVDLAIAASAILHDAVFWTLDPRDFADVPRLRLLQEAVRVIAGRPPDPAPRSCRPTAAPLI